MRKRSIVLLAGCMLAAGALCLASCGGGRHAPQSSPPLQGAGALAAADEQASLSESIPPVPGGADAGAPPTEPAPAEACPDAPAAMTHIGVLVSSIEDALQDEGTSVMEGAFGVILAEGETYRLFYFPDPENGLPVDVAAGTASGSTGETRHFDKVTFATVETGKLMGIGGPFALVRFEVNCGKDAVIGPEFVMTKVEVLDGTAEYPLKTAEVMAGLLKRNKKQIASLKPKMEKLLKKERAKLVSKGTKFDTYEAVTPFAVWKDGQLVVRVRTRIYETRFGWSCPVPTSGPCAAPSAVITVDYTMTFVVDKKGSVVSTVKGKLESSARQLPPPP